MIISPFDNVMKNAFASPFRRKRALKSFRIQPIVVVGASNSMGGDDSAGAQLNPSLDEDNRIYFLYPADGSIANLDVTNGIPRPGGFDTSSTTPAINMAKILKNVNSDTVYVIVPTAVGGRGIYNGGDVVGLGPWHPDGTGAAWNIGGTAEASAVSGALYKSHTSGNWKSAFDAAAGTTFPGYSINSPIFFGHPCNENDTGGKWSEMSNAAERCINGIRAAWGAANATWVLHGGPPEWTYQGSYARKKITSINYHLARKMPGVLYVEGQESNQHPTEAIHFNNAGYRLLGSKCGNAVARQAPTSGKFVDWIDSITNKPQRAYGLYRWISTYTGSAFKLHNGTAEVDIGFDTNGYPDISAIETHVGTGTGYITAIYDQMGSGNTMIPEGSSNALLVSGGEIITQGKLLAWGADSNNIMMKDTSYSVLTGGALLAIGRSKDAGNPVMLAGSQNTLGIFAIGGNLSYAKGTSIEYKMGFKQALEPSWLSVGSGFNIFTNYVDANGLHVDGMAQDEGAAGALTYGSTALAWGGRVGQTNRYSNGSHVGAFAWDVAPTGEDKTTIQNWAKIVGKDDTFTNNGFSNAFNSGFGLGG